MQITLRGVGYTYPGAPCATLSDVTLTFACGWTGIVGPNGSGKTTLASLVCGYATPTCGAISSPSLRAAYCAQRVDVAPPLAAEFACDWSRLAVRLRAQLAIEDDWPWRFDTLSAGERKRLQLACALAIEPDVLVLDEPTNFLDAPTRERIIESLRSFGGVGLLISHDRELLDALATKCVFVEDGRCTMRPGTYSAARAQAELERTATQARRVQAVRNLNRLEEEKRRRSAEAARAHANRSGRGLDPHDHDAREKLGRYIVSGQDGKKGRLSSAMDSRLAAARQTLETAMVSKRYEGNVWLDTAPHQRKTLVRLEECSLALGDDRVLSVPALSLGHRDHVGVTGPNGGGKSTLVRHLIGRVPTDIPLLYLPQEPDAAHAQRVLDQLRALPDTQRGQVLSIVAQLGSRPQALAASDSPSPGELRKLMLALGILARPALIVMDEPTNHMDITATEALQRMLPSCPCAVLVVSHDSGLIDAVATTARWEVDEGAVQVRS